MPIQVQRRLSRSPLPEQLTVEQLRELGSAGDRMVMAAAFSVMAERGLLPDGTRRAALVGPQTDEELLDAVEELTGYHIPRVAVCTEHGHKAPSQTFCDLYFERVSDVLWIGNRGGGKTTNSGFLHGAKARYHPGYQTGVAGAQEIQGYRAYAELKRFIRYVGDEVVATLLSKTTWANGAQNEVYGGTVRALNGPHPVFAQMDEAELTTEDPFQEFLNMAQSTAQYARQQLLTSTRKRAHGIVQGIVKTVQDAERDGTQAPWRVDIFCVFETMANVPNCRTAPENAGRPDSELCGCHKVQKGENDDGSPRTFDKECQGKGYRSDGFVQLDDVHRRFIQLSPSVWGAQQRCLTPDVEGIVHKWVKDKHRLPSWVPYPEFGPIRRTWDWGGQNPHAMLWFQKLTVPVGLAWWTVETPEGERHVLTPIMDDDDQREAVHTLPEGAHILFDEIYGDAQQLGEYSTLGLRAVLHEIQWRQIGVEMQVDLDFCDPAGYIAKREVRKAVTQLQNQIGQAEANPEADPSAFFDQETLELLSEMNIPLASLAEQDIRVPEFKSIPAPRVESIRKMIEIGEDDMLYYVPRMAPGFDDEIDVYHWLETKPGKNAPEDAAKEDDHAMDAARYYLWNDMRMEDRSTGEVPSSMPKEGPEVAPPSKFAPPKTVPGDTSVPDRTVVEPAAGSVPRSRPFTRARSSRSPLPGRG
jgi:hypothetical protein